MSGRPRDEAPATSMSSGTPPATPGSRPPRALIRRLLRRTRAPLFGLVCLAIWELVSLANTAAIPRANVPAPTDIVRALVSQGATHTFWVSLGQTAEGCGAGLGLAAAAAVPVGLAIGSSATLYALLRGLIELLRPIPSVAVLPLAVLVLGIGLRLALVLVAVGAFWPLLIQTIYGVQDVDPEARDMGRAYGLGRIGIFVRVTLPGSAPYVMTGLRISAIVALNVVIAAEFVVGSTGGFGSMMNLLANANRIPELYSYIVASGILGLLINVALRRAERRILRWHHSQRRIEPL